MQLIIEFWGLALKIKSLFAPDGRIGILQAFCLKIPVEYFPRQEGILVSQNLSEKKNITANNSEQVL